MVNDQPHLKIDFNRVKKERAWYLK
jgi:hypothetical protein